MRVLFTAHGAYGHLLPLMGLARALADGGHDVVVATSSAFGAVVAAHGLTPHPAGMDDDAMVAEAQRQWPETACQPPSAWAIRMFCEIAAPAMAADVAALIATWRPDVVVREEGEYGGPVAAAASGVPWATVGWGSPLRPPEALAELGRLVAPLWQSAGIRRPVGHGLYGAVAFDQCPPSLYAGRPPVGNRHGLRPAVAAEVDGPSLEARSTRPLAYVGFGTAPLFRDAPDLTRIAVLALVKRGFHVSVTTGDERLARELEAVRPDRVQAHGWVDLGRLMPLCDLVICHGGAGTVLAALGAGVPLVLLPRGAPSQIRMSSACEARGVGRAVVWDGTNTEELGAAVDDVMSSERFRSAAREVSKEISEMPAPSTAVEILSGIAAQST
ncbi:MAG: glycosyltransferase [Actinomycetota bacterium]|nr:glycosyltransferase [Actinomycetota bacterium]